MTTKRGDQRGFVSIIVTMVLVALISLVTVSFSLLVRRENRQALDRQLSTQALYAAESGVNDAVNKLKATPGYQNSECDGSSKDLGDGLSYSCVLVDTAPDSLVYSPISTNNSKIIRVDAPGATSIKFSWQPEDISDSNPPNYVDTNGVSSLLLPTNDSTGPYAEQLRRSGVLRLSLIPVPSDGFSRDYLINNTQTLFLFPSKNDNGGQQGTWAYTDNITAQGEIVRGECNTGNTYHCNLEITGLPAGVSTYYVRLKSVYNNQNVSITATNAQSERVTFSGTQAVVDATGKANDVLRRVQVRVPLRTEYVYPENAVETTDSLCKLIVVGGSALTVGAADTCTTLRDY